MPQTGWRLSRRSPALQDSRQTEHSSGVMALMGGRFKKLGDLQRAFWGHGTMPGFYRSKPRNKNFSTKSSRLKATLPQGSPHLHSGS